VRLQFAKKLRQPLQLLATTNGLKLRDGLGSKAWSPAAAVSLAKVPSARFGLPGLVILSSSPQSNLAGLSMKKVKNKKKRR
jgi:hypothetical protein